VPAQTGRDLPGRLGVAADQQEVQSPAANSAASVPPMLPVPMIATVLSKLLTLIHLP
jgi:hypothetical protein